VSDRDPGEPRRPHPLDLAWLKLGQDWSWLAVVPAEPGLDVTPLARALAAVGADVSARRVEFLDGTGLEPAGVHAFVTELRKEKREARAVVALACPLGHPAALEVARAAEGVVLCARRGSTRVASARATALAVGLDRLVCSLLVDGEPAAR